MEGEDVRLLQVFLNTHGFPVSTTGAGSLGQETISFLTGTEAALMRYQSASGIQPASGFLGPLTRAKILSVVTPETKQNNVRGTPEPVSEDVTPKRKTTRGGSSNNSSSDTVPPVVSGGGPSGTLARNTAATTIEVTTDETAICAYSTSPGTLYDSMTAFGTTNSTAHASLISGLSNGGGYVYYIKCEDSASNRTVADYVVSFAVAATAAAPSVSITTPTSSQTVSGSSVTISATATDDIAVVGVQFKVDGVNVGVEDTVAPYSTT